MTVCSQSVPQIRRLCPYAFKMSDTAPRTDFGSLGPELILKTVFSRTRSVVEHALVYSISNT